MSHRRFVLRARVAAVGPDLVVVRPWVPGHQPLCPGRCGPGYYSASVSGDATGACGGASAHPGLCDLLGVLAYGKLSTFDRLAADARGAPTLDGRVALSRLAAVEVGHHQLLDKHLAGLGVSVLGAMSPFVALRDAYDAQTVPRTWLESLVKAYIGDGLAAEFYRQIAAGLPEGTAELVDLVTADAGYGAFVEREVRATVVDPQVRDRLTLWGRRLFGEVVTQGQLILAERPALARLLTGADQTAATVTTATLVKRAQAGHRRRMTDLGLKS